MIYFTQTLWPDFTFWHLLAGVFYYQRYCGVMCDVKNQLKNLSIADDVKRQLGMHPSACEAVVESGDQMQANARVVDFLDKFMRRKHEQLVKLSEMNVSHA